MASAIGSGKNPTYVDANGRAVASTETVGSDTKPVYMEGGVLKETSKLAPLASPTFTGAPKAPTPTDASDDKQVVNKEYLLNKIGGVSTLSLKDVYPVGSVYITMNADIPAAFRVGMTWVKLTEGRCLWNATNDQLGVRDLSASLPDIYAEFDSYSTGAWEYLNGCGACFPKAIHGRDPALDPFSEYDKGTYKETTKTRPSYPGSQDDGHGQPTDKLYDVDCAMTFKAGRYNPVYLGSAGTDVVRPNSIAVTMWQRTA